MKELANSPEPSPVAPAAEPSAAASPGHAADWQFMQFSGALAVGGDEGTEEGGDGDGATNASDGKTGDATAASDDPAPAPEPSGGDDGGPSDGSGADTSGGDPSGGTTPEHGNEATDSAQAARDDGGGGDDETGAAQGKGAYHAPRGIVFSAAAAMASMATRQAPYYAELVKAFGQRLVTRVVWIDDADALLEALGPRGMAFSYKGRLFIALRRDATLQEAAHELAHHMANRQAKPQLAGGIGTPGDSYEQAADHAAARAERGEVVYSDDDDARHGQGAGPATAQASGLWGWLKQKGSAAKNAVVSQLNKTAVGRGLVQWGKATVSASKWVAGKVWDGTKWAASKAWQGAKWVANAWWNTAKFFGGFWLGGLLGIGSCIKDIVMGLVDVLKMLGKAVVGIATFLIDFLRSPSGAITKLWEKIKAGWSKLGEAIKKAPGSIWKKFTEASVFGKGKMIGNAIGYIAAMVLLIIFTGGAAAGALAASRFGWIIRVLNFFDKAGDMFFIVGKTFKAGKAAGKMAAGLARGGRGAGRAANAAEEGAEALTHHADDVAERARNADNTGSLEADQSPPRQAQDGEQAPHQDSESPHGDGENTPHEDNARRREFDGSAQMMDDLGLLWRSMGDAITGLRQMRRADLADRGRELRRQFDDLRGMSARDWTEAATTRARQLSADTSEFYALYKKAKADAKAAKEAAKQARAEEKQRQRDLAAEEKRLAAERERTANQQAADASDAQEPSATSRDGTPDGHETSAALAATQRQVDEMFEFVFVAVDHINHAGVLGAQRAWRNLYDRFLVLKGASDYAAHADEIAVLHRDFADFKQQLSALRDMAPSQKRPAPIPPGPVPSHFDQATRAQANQRAQQVTEVLEATEHLDETLAAGTSLLTRHRAAVLADDLRELRRHMPYFNDPLTEREMGQLLAYQDEIERLHREARDLGPSAHADTSAATSSANSASPEAPSNQIRPAATEDVTSTPPSLSTATSSPAASKFRIKPKAAPAAPDSAFLDVDDIRFVSDGNRYVGELDLSRVRVEPRINGNELRFSLVTELDGKTFSFASATMVRQADGTITGSWEFSNRIRLGEREAAGVVRLRDGGAPVSLPDLVVRQADTLAMQHFGRRLDSQHGKWVDSNAAAYRRELENAKAMGLTGDQAKRYALSQTPSGKAMHAHGFEPNLAGLDESALETGHIVGVQFSRRDVQRLAAETGPAPNTVPTSPPGLVPAHVDDDLATEWAPRREQTFDPDATGEFGPVDGDGTLDLKNPLNRTEQTPPPPVEYYQVNSAEAPSATTPLDFPSNLPRAADPNAPALASPTGIDRDHPFRFEVDGREWRSAGGTITAPDGRKFAVLAATPTTILRDDATGAYYRLEHVHSPNCKVVKLEARVAESWLGHHIETPLGRFRREGDELHGSDGTILVPVYSKTLPDKILYRNTETGQIIQQDLHTQNFVTPPDGPLGFPVINELESLAWVENGKLLHMVKQGEFYVEFKIGTGEILTIGRLEGTTLVRVPLSEVPPTVDAFVCPGYLSSTQKPLLVAVHSGQNGWQTGRYYETDAGVFDPDIGSTSDYGVFVTDTGKSATVRNQGMTFSPSNDIKPLIHDNRPWKPLHHQRFPDSYGTTVRTDGDGQVLVFDLNGKPVKAPTLVSTDRQFLIHDGTIYRLELHPHLSNEHLAVRVDNVLRGYQFTGHTVADLKARLIEAGAAANPYQLRQEILAGDGPMLRQAFGDNPMPKLQALCGSAPEDFPFIIGHRTTGADDIHLNPRATHDFSPGSYGFFKLENGQPVPASIGEVESYMHRVIADTQKLVPIQAMPKPSHVSLAGLADLDTVPVWATSFADTYRREIQRIRSISLNEVPPNMELSHVLTAQLSDGTVVCRPVYTRQAFDNSMSHHDASPEVLRRHMEQMPDMLWHNTRQITLDGSHPSHLATYDWTSGRLNLIAGLDKPGSLNTVVHELAGHGTELGDGNAHRLLAMANYLDAQHGANYMEWSYHDGIWEMHATNMESYFDDPIEFATRRPHTARLYSALLSEPKVDSEVWRAFIGRGSPQAAMMLFLGSVVTLQLTRNQARQENGT